MGVPAVVIGGDTFEVNGNNLYPLSIEKTDDFSIGLYPNPNKGSFNVELIGYTGVVNMQLYDLSGKIVHHDKLISMRGTSQKLSIESKSRNLLGKV